MNEQSPCPLFSSRNVSAMEIPDWVTTKILRELAEKNYVKLPSDEELWKMGSVIVPAEFFKIIMEDITANRAKIKDLEETIERMHSGQEPLIPEE